MAKEMNFFLGYAAHWPPVLRLSVYGWYGL